MEVSGSIKVIGAVQAVTPTFNKRELVIQTAEQYPQTVMIEFVQDKCSILDNYKIGDEVKVGINIRGREWTNPQGKIVYFNSLHGWRIDKTGATALAPTKRQAPQVDEDYDDGLPF